MEEFLKHSEDFHIYNVPPIVYYIPNFITEEEEETIIKRFYEAPKPKWTQLSNRRLQNWGGIPHPKGMIAEPIPCWLQIYIDKINKLNLMNGNCPNHVLANEYLPGQGIMPHSDGPLFYPAITTISCGSHTIINFSERSNYEKEIGEKEQKHSILLERRSLFIVQQEMYENFMHSIEETDCDIITDKIVNILQCKNYCIGDKAIRKTRISLTIRHVPKTTKVKIKI